MYPDLRVSQQWLPRWRAHLESDKYIDLQFLSEFEVQYSVGALRRVPVVVYYAEELRMVMSSYSNAVPVAAQQHQEKLPRLHNQR